MTNKVKHIPQGYKDSPLGIIPQDWEVKRLDNLFSFKNGINANKESYGEGIPFVNTMDVLNNTFLKTDVLRGKVNVSPKTKEEFGVVYGDVLFNRTSETREEVGCSSVYIDTEESVFGGFIIRAHDISSNMFYDFYKGYCFQPFYIRSQIVSLGNGAIRYNLGQEDLSRVKVLVPPIIEQQRIVSVLQLWDTAIEKQSELIEKLKLRKRALMQQLLTGKKRLPGFSGEWKKVKLRDIAEIVGGGTPNTNISHYWNGGIPWFTPTEIGKTKYVSESERTISTHGQYNSSAKMLPKGTILFTSRATIGAKAILTVEATTNQGFQSLIVHNGNNNEFIYYYLDVILKSIKQKASGSTFAEVSAESLRKIEIIIPPKEEQNAIASIFINADKEIELVNEKLASLQSQKRGLMQQLLTGKKRIIG